MSDIPQNHTTDMDLEDLSICAALHAAGQEKATELVGYFATRRKKIELAEEEHDANIKAWIQTNCPDMHCSEFPFRVEYFIKENLLDVFNGTMQIGTRSIPAYEFTDTADDAK